MRRVVPMLLLAACLSSAQPALAADPAFTVEAMSFTVTVGPDDGTTCTVDADLYKPRGASARKPMPAILATNGFGGDKTRFSGVGAAYAERGGPDARAVEGPPGPAPPYPGRHPCER
jgi:hypothetical protein